MGVRQWNSRFGKQALLLCALLVLTVGASVVCWSQSSEQKNTRFPARVCNGTFSGSEVKPFYGGAKGELEQETIRGFPGVFGKTHGLGAVCETSVGNMSVNFRVQHMRWGKSKSELEKESKYVTVLGAGYGEYSRDRGSMSLRVPCPTHESQEASLNLNVGATAARGGSGRGASRLADLTGYAARTLAQEVYKCKGAGGLPKGPVVIKRGEGNR